MLTSDFKEFAELLLLNKVEFLIVGGYALAAYGHPRYTGDLDFWVGTDSRNGEKIIKTLQMFGFASLPLTAQDFTVPNQAVQLGYPPRRIDLLTGIDGVDFKDCCTRRLVVEIDGMQLPFIGLEDFKINKAAAGRSKDIADLDSLR